MKCDDIVKKSILEIEKTVGTNISDIYKSNLYWSQKPYNICDILLRNFTKPDDVIMDPFMGSGVTIIEGLKKNFNTKPIGIEINDYPIYLVNTLLKNYDIDDVEIHFKRLLVCLEKINSKYYSVCKCCEKSVILTKSMFEYKEDHSKYLTKVYYSCDCCNKVKEHKPSIADEYNFHKNDNEKFEYFENIDLLADSRVAVKEGEKLYDIFTSRNLSVINDILAIIKDEKYSELMIYSLLGIMHLCKITDIKSSSQWPLWTPKRECIEKNIVRIYEKSLKKTLKAIISLKKEIGNGIQKQDSFDNLLGVNKSFLIIKKATQFVDDSILPNECVDFILTDPPYMGQAIYSEYMQLYQPVLKTAIDFKNEIVIAKCASRRKDEALYFSELNSAFEQIARCLKMNKYMCMYFHDASFKIWNNIINIMLNNNLIFRGIAHVTKNKNTLKNIVSPKKSMNGDAILFFQKVECVNNPPQNDEQLEAHLDNIVQITREIIINNSGKATTAWIYDNGVLEYLINNNLLNTISKKYKDLTEILIDIFPWNSQGFWTL